MATQMSKREKFVADEVFFTEMNEVLTRELAEDGYSGVEVRVTPMRMEIIIRATRTQNVLGEKGRRIRELTSVAQKRFKFPENSVELYAEKAEPLRYKLLGGLAGLGCLAIIRYIETIKPAQYFNKCYEGYSINSFLLYFLLHYYKRNFGSRTNTVFCGVFDRHGPYGHMVTKRERDSLPLKLSAHWEVNITSGDVLRFQP
ncbi:hypothetical protein UlMin_042726 [Ulmus minor]